MGTFEELGIAGPTREALIEFGYSEPTPFQTLAIPCLCQKRDLFGRIENHAGNVVSYALPIIERILTDGPAYGPTALVLVPVSYSKLCVADKLAITLEPHWLYLPRVNWTGEINEYMAQAKNGDGKYKTMKITTESQKKWFADVCDYLQKWVDEHKDLKTDTWTPEAKKAITTSGVWK